MHQSKLKTVLLSLHKNVNINLKKFRNLDELKNHEDVDLNLMKKYNMVSEITNREKTWKEKMKYVLQAMRMDFVQTKKVRNFGRSIYFGI